MGIEVLQDKFNLSSDDLDGLKKTPFEYLKVEETKGDSYIFINPSDIIGTINSAFCFDTFYEFYDSFHKGKLLDDTSFNDAIVQPRNGDYPSVYLKDGKYYLNDGRHRVILSQLHKLASIKVLLLK